MAPASILQPSSEPPPPSHCTTSAGLLECPPVQTLEPPPPRLQPGCRRGQGRGRWGQGGRSQQGEPYPCPLRLPRTQARQVQGGGATARPFGGNHPPAPSRPSVQRPRRGPSRARTLPPLASRPWQHSAAWLRGAAGRAGAPGSGSGSGRRVGGRRPRCYCCCRRAATARASCAEAKAKLGHWQQIPLPDAARR